jgi:hypothetical protein
MNIVINIIKMGALNEKRYKIISKFIILSKSKIN